jgi:predicted dehydrogenase
METGVDDSCTIVLLYSRGRMAQINISISNLMFAPTFIIGDKGIIQIPELSWRPKKLILPNNETFESEYPVNNLETQYGNYTPMIYQAEGVRDAISKGLTQHPSMTHDDSRIVMHIMDEARRQLGYIMNID